VKIPNLVIVSPGCGHLARTGALDRLIRLATGIRKNPILVLGPDGDDLLSGSSEIEQCDLVFDPNYSGNFFSGLKAGLQAIKEAAFVVPLTDAIPEQGAWKRLENQLMQEALKTQCDVVRPLTQFNTNPELTLPFLVTAQGVRNLVTLPAATEWETCGQITVSLAPISEDPVPDRQAG
jgi:hypothetical protein